MDIVENGPLDGNAASDTREPRTTRRQRVVVGGHRGDLEVVVAHRDDDDPDVRAAVISALAKLDALDDDQLVAALCDRAPTVRRRAAELAATVAIGQRTLASLIDALGDDDPLVVDAACWALGEAGDENAVEPLIDVSADHEDIRCREAAVAALGAIGDERALDAIIARLDDKPTVRRRVVVALASFGGPRVDEALDRCRVDHDWQVRQAVEMLEKEPG